MDNVKFQIQKMIEIVANLEKDLYTASTIAHDGEYDGKKVQIKITQQEDIVINHEPEVLIVMLQK